ncbi:uncharacterized protein [Mytilus edulis]|uniref:uncharacterized protein isoform X2 n=1 Tax=Mytilus edulis TaxID=6550 RepID=UPI0039EF5BB8
MNGRQLDDENESVYNNTRSRVRRRRQDPVRGGQELRLRMAPREQQQPPVRNERMRPQVEVDEDAPEVRRRRVDEGDLDNSSQSGPSRPQTAASSTIYQRWMSVFVALLIHLVLQETTPFCAFSCMEQWINHHRMGPTDIFLLYPRYCSLVQSSLCKRPMDITLMDEQNLSVMNIKNCVSSLNVNNTGTIVAIGNLRALQTKKQNQLEHDDPIQLHTFFPDFQTEEFLTEIEDVLNSTNGDLKLCNDFDKYKMYGNPGIVLEKRPTMFSLDYIFHDRYTTKSNNTIRIRVFASKDVDCATIMNDVLIFITSIGFVQGIYTFPNQPYQEDLAIIQHLHDMNTIYITEDGQSYLLNWICFRLVFYVLFCFLTVKIWRFISKMSEAKPHYRFSGTSFQIYICNPLLISTNTPFMDMLITYILKRAWFRKVLIIGSSYVATHTMLLIFHKTTQLIDMNQVIFISVYYSVLLFIIFMIECLSNFIGKSVKLLPEPIETFESSIMSSLPVCLSFSLVSILTVQNPFLFVATKLASIYKSAVHICAASSILNTTLLVPVLLNYNMSKNLYLMWNQFSMSLLMSKFISKDVAICYISFYIFQLSFFRYLLFIVDHISSLLQILFNLYNQSVILMISIKIWIPLIFLCISYLKDVLNEYNKVYQDCYKVVVRLLKKQEKKGNQCIKDKKVAFLVMGKNPKIDTTKCEISSNVILFYNHGDVHITPKFFYEIRKVLEEVVGFSLSIKQIFCKEFMVFIFRTYPIIFTMLVLKMSNFSSDQFESVEQFLVSLVLFHLYSKLCLHRSSPNNDISSNEYLENQIQVLVREHEDTFNVSRLNNQDIDYPVLTYGLKIAAAVSVVTVVSIYLFSLLEINVLQIDVFPVLLYRYFRNSEIMILHNAIVIIFLIYFVLLHFVK